MKSASLVLLLAMLAFDASAQSGLIARYLLNNNANNSVGTNHGTVVNAVPTADRFGNPGSAYQFNGIDSRIEFGAPPPLGQVSSWTLAAWLKPASFSQTGLAVYVGFDNGVNIADGFGFGLNGNSAFHGFLLFAGGFVNSGQSFPNTNVWTHVVMLRTNGITSFYVNGVQTPNTSSVNVNLPSDFTIGSQNGPARFYNGAVDDVRIYNRALTSNEIAQVYASNEACYPHAATATAILFNGFVVGANITDDGCGYTNVPTVSIVGGGGSNATATATITNGRVIAINIANPGCCYTNTPQIIIGSPPFPSAVKIRVSKVIVTAHVTIGRQYVLEGSQNLIDWNEVTPPFLAQTEDVDFEFAVGLYQFFRTREIP